MVPYLGGWTSIYHLFWCSLGYHGFDPYPMYWSQQLSFLYTEGGDKVSLCPWNIGPLPLGETGHGQKLFHQGLKSGCCNPTAIGLSIGFILMSCIERLTFTITDGMAVNKLTDWVYSYIRNQEEQSLCFLETWKNIFLGQPRITFPSPFRVAGVGRSIITRY